MRGLRGVYARPHIQCTERDGTPIYEWQDASMQGWWIQVSENAEARRFFSHHSLKDGTGYLEMTRWIAECREYRRMKDEVFT